MNNSLLLHQKTVFFLPTHLLFAPSVPIDFFYIVSFEEPFFRAVFMIKNVHFLRNYLASRYIMFHSNILINDIYKR